MPMRPSFRISIAIYEEVVSEGDGIAETRRIYLIALPNLANDILRRDLHVVKVDRTRRGRTDAELLLLLGDLHAHVFSGNEAGDTLVALAWIYVGEDEEYLGFV